MSMVLQNELLTSTDNSSHLPNNSENGYHNFCFKNAKPEAIECDLFWPSGKYLIVQDLNKDAVLLFFIQ